MLAGAVNVAPAAGGGERDSERRGGGVAVQDDVVQKHGGEGGGLLAVGIETDAADIRAGQLERARGDIDAAADQRFAGGLQLEASAVKYMRGPLRMGDARRAGGQGGAGELDALGRGRQVEGE